MKKVEHIFRPQQKCYHCHYIPLFLNRRLTSVILTRVITVEPAQTSWMTTAVTVWPELKVNGRNHTFNPINHDYLYFYIHWIAIVPEMIIKYLTSKEQKVWNSQAANVEVFMMYLFILPLSR